MSPTTRRIAIVGLLLVAALFVRLGFWQVARLSERRAEGRATLAARAKPVLQLAEQEGTPVRGLDGRWVEAVGVYDHGHEIVLRGQSFEGSPGVQVVTPLRQAASDTAVLVLRGFVPAPDAVRVSIDSLVERGTVRVRGVAAPVGSGGGQPVDHAGRTTWARLDLEALRQRLPYPVSPVLVRQTPDPSLLPIPRRLAVPQPSDGPHLNYAIQWFVFASLTAGFAVLVVGRTRDSPGGTP